MPLSTLESAACVHPTVPSAGAQQIRLPDNVLFSISARIGGSGLDLDSHEALKGAWNADLLARAVAYDNRQKDIPAFAVRSLRWHPVRLLSFLGSRYYYGAKKHYLDWICAREIATGGYDLVHSWSGGALVCIG